MFKRIARRVWRQVILSGAATQGISEREVEDTSCHYPATEATSAPMRRLVRLSDTPWVAHGEEVK